MKESASYEIMGLGDKPYSYREVAELTADCIIGAVNRIRPVGDTEWKMLRDTEFGTMLPQINARWELEESIIKRRFPWYFHTLMAVIALSLLSFGWTTIIAAAELEPEEYLRYYFIPLILSAVAGVLNLLFFFSLLCHYWQLIPRQLNKIPPAVRVIPIIVPLLGGLWSFFGFYALAVKLKEVHLKSGLRREKDCVAIALVGCICYSLFYLGGFFFAASILPIVIGCCGYFCMNCMKDQALDILNKRLRINFDTGIVTPSTPVEPALRKFVKPRRSYWAWLILAAALGLWGLPAIAGIGTWYILKNWAPKPEIIASSLSDEERRELTAACDRLEAAIKKADPGNRIMLSYGATDSELEELRKGFGGQQVETLELFLRRFNGSRFNIMPDGKLISCREMTLQHSSSLLYQAYLPDELKHSVPLVMGGTEGQFKLLLNYPGGPMVSYENWSEFDEDDLPQARHLSMTEFVNLLAEGIEEKAWVPGEVLKPGEAYHALLLKYMPHVEEEEEEPPPSPPKSPLDLIRRHL